MLASRVRTVAKGITVGVHRTPVQDIEFSIRHLEEIAVRVLSPGINDPCTAVAVIHRLTASLSRLMDEALPQGVFRDQDGTVRAICPQSSYASLLSASFDQIRQNGADKLLIVIHLLQASEQIARCARTDAQRAALGEQARDILADAEREAASPSDLSDVVEEMRQAREAIARKGRA
jgi:uncharacterized membrane protein